MQLPARRQSCTCEKLGSGPAPRTEPPTLAGCHLSRPSDLATRGRSLTLGAGGDVLEGQREQPAAGKGIGRWRDLREVGLSGGGDKVPGKRTVKGWSLQTPMGRAYRGRAFGGGAQEKGLRNLGAPTESAAGDQIFAVGR